MKEELLLFSGGLDSTVLLKFFLKDTNKKLRVVYNKLGYDNLANDRLIEQNKAADNILNYFYKKYRHFEYSYMNIDFSFYRREIHQLWLDDQWNAFLSGILCRDYNIETVWLAYFSYNYNNRKKLKGDTAYWYHDGSLDKILKIGYQLGTNKECNAKLCLPFYAFKGTLIDSLKTKKEAYDYLEPELQKMIRSCFGKEKFCGKCFKCETYIKEKIKND